MWPLLTWSALWKPPNPSSWGSLVRCPPATCPFTRSRYLPSCLPLGLAGFLPCVVTCLVDVSLCVCPVLQIQLIQRGLSRDEGGGVAVWSPGLESEQLGQVLWLCYILNFSFPHLGCGERTRPTSKLHRNSCENLYLSCTQNTRCSWQQRRQWENVPNTLFQQLRAARKRREACRSTGLSWWKRMGGGGGDPAPSSQRWQAECLLCGLALGPAPPPLLPRAGCLWGSKALRGNLASSPNCLPPLFM